MSATSSGTVTGIVLAGGLGRRMGDTVDGVDKGLLSLSGKPLVAHVIERLVPQVDVLLVNANRNADSYAQFGCQVVPDVIGGFAGPLAGLHAGMLAAATEWVVTAPCDSPLLPPNLVERLHAAARANRREL